MQHTEVCIDIYECKEINPIYGIIKREIIVHKAPIDKYMHREAIHRAETMIFLFTRTRANRNGFSESNFLILLNETQNKTNNK